MARSVTVSLVDDLTGTRADETVAFGIDGKDYEIDLSHGSAAQLRETFADYIAAARKHSGHRKTGRPPAARPAANTKQNEAIRQWARETGIEMSARGRIPTGVRDAFHAATSPT